VFRRVRSARRVESPVSNRSASLHRVRSMDSTTPSDEPHPVHTPASAIRVARIGGTIADVAAAAFSAHTLYHLGGQLDLGPWTAWLLPAALDVFAFTALATGYSLPVDHPGQKHVLRTARLAFAMTVGSNFLDHFLQKAGQLVDPTVRDLLLVVVATLPSLVVERLLNLQSHLTGRRTAGPDDKVLEQAGGPSPDHLAGQGSLAHEEHQSKIRPSGWPRDEQPAPMTDHWAARRAHGRPDWTIEGAAPFADLSSRLGRRPSAREFQQELAILTRSLIANGQMEAGTRPPSITTAKRVRTALEAAEPTRSGPFDGEGPVLARPGRPVGPCEHSSPTD